PQTSTHRHLRRPHTHTHAHTRTHTHTHRVSVHPSTCHLTKGYSLVSRGPKKNKRWRGEREREKERKKERERERLVGSMKRVVIGYVGWHCSPTGTDLAMIRKGVLRWRKSSLSVCG